MDKQQLLRELKAAVDSGAVEMNEVNALFASSTATESSKVNFSTVLYYVGGIVVLIGLAVFFEQQWEDLSSAFRIIVTLGTGLAFLVSGILLSQVKKIDQVPSALFLMSGLLVPSGVFVTLYELEFGGGNFGPGIIFLFLSFAYAVIAYMFRRSLLALFSVAYGTIALLLISDALVSGAPYWEEDVFTYYRLFAIGASYLFLGYALQKSHWQRLAPWLYGVGSVFVLGTSLALGGWSPDQRVIWELSYLPLVFLMMYVSLKVLSRAMLIVSSIGLVSYLFKITAEYFQDWISWPLLLVLAGTVLIGVGYLTYYLNNKYISTKS